MKHRITKGFLAQLPAEVAQQVFLWKAQYKKAFVSIEDRANVYAQEDAQYTAFNTATGKSMSVQAAGEFAGHTKLSPTAEIPLPVGCVLVASGFFCGLPWMTIYHNAGLKLEGGK